MTRTPPGRSSAAARAAIASGLDGVTEVVTGGAAYLSDGSRVERSAK